MYKDGEIDDCIFAYLHRRESTVLVFLSHCAMYAIFINNQHRKQQVVMHVHFFAIECNEINNCNNNK